VQVNVEVLQTWPSPHVPFVVPPHWAPPTFVQHGWFGPPHSTQVFEPVLHVEYGATQPTPLGQHGNPRPPHETPAFVHVGVSVVVEQLPSLPPPEIAHEFPAFTHMPVLWSQQPVLQTLLSQHGWVAPPHVAQFPLVALHALPDCVQKFSDALSVPGLPAHAFEPLLPQFVQW
jgi:hypothetical protein